METRALSQYLESVMLGMQEWNEYQCNRWMLQQEKIMRELWVFL